MLPRYLVVVLVLFVAPILILKRTSAAPTCVPIAENCPFGVPENSPLDATSTECSGQGTCLFGACNCTQGFADFDCSARLRKTKVASAVITQGGKL